MSASRSSDIPRRNGLASWAIVLATALLVAACSSAPASAATIELNPGDLNAFPSDSSAGDFDGDGTLDLAVSEKVPFEVDVSVAFGDGAGDFAEPVGSTNIPEAAAPFPVADLNGDGRDDLTSPWIAFSDGGGAFDVDPNETFLRGSPADLDGDGDIDLLRLTRGEELQATTLLNDGTGNFEAGPSAALPTTQVSDVEFSDVDGDSAVDLVLCDSESAGDEPKLSAFLNDGAGGFSEAPEADDPAPCENVAAGDLNDDGFDDLVTNRFAVRLGSGTGELATGDAIGSRADEAESVAIGDIDRDGTADVVATTSRIEIWLGQGDATFGSSPGRRIPSDQNEVEIISLDGVGPPDDLLGRAYDGETVWANETGEAVPSPRTSQGTDSPIYTQGLNGFDFNTSDPGAVTECSLDFGPYRPCAEGFEDSLSEGRHVIKGRASGPTGQDPTPSQQVVVVDTVAPQPELDPASRTNGFPSFNIIPGLTDDDRYVTGTFKVAGGARTGTFSAVRYPFGEGDYFNGGTSTVETRRLLGAPRRESRGSHELILRARDRAGNTTVLRRTFRVR